MSRFGKRIFRDLAAVVIFCSAFVGVVLMINYLKAGEDLAETTDFSEFRISADAATKSQDHATALSNFETLLSRDPFDGRARYMLAMTRYRVYRQLNNKLSEIASVGEPAVDAAQSQVENLKKERQVIVELCIAEFETALEHPRYKVNCCYFLSALYVANNEYDLAIERLSTFVNAGRYHPHGLENVEMFKSLRGHPKFEAVVRKESQTRRQRLQGVATREQAIDGASEGVRSGDSGSVSFERGEMSLVASYRGWFGYNMIRLGRKLVDFVRESFK